MKKHLKCVYATPCVMGAHTEPRDNDTQWKTHYLDSLAVVHFHYVEVKTVNPFAWRDEVTSLLVKILPDVHENLKEKQSRQKEEGGAALTALLSLSAVSLERLFTELLRHATFIARTC